MRTWIKHMDTLLARQCEPTSREDSRIHEGGHAEVGQSEEEDDGDIEGDHSGQVVRQPRAPGEDDMTQLSPRIH